MLGHSCPKPFSNERVKRDYRMQVPNKRWVVHSPIGLGKVFPNTVPDSTLTVRFKALKMSVIPIGRDRTESLLPRGRPIIQPLSEGFFLCDRKVPSANFFKS